MLASNHFLNLRRKRSKVLNGRLGVRVRFKHVHRFKDRHGKVRNYVRISGRGKAIPITADPEDQVEFARQYDRALETLGGKVRSRRIKAGSWAALIAQYKTWADFKDLGPSTKHKKLQRIERWIDQWEDLPFRETTHADVMKLRSLIDAPTTANTIVSDISSIIKAAVRHGLMDHNPAELRSLGVKRRKSTSGNRYVWTAADFKKFVDFYPIGTMEHLALKLLWCTGVRVSDACRLGPQHIRNGNLEFTEYKDSNSKAQGREPKERCIPILPMLQQAIDATPSHALAFIVKRKPSKLGSILTGVPYADGNTFGAWFKRACKEAGLPKQCAAHGVRRGSATGAAEHGATEHQIMSIFGWSTPEQARVYTQKAQRKALTARSIDLLGLGRE